MTIPNLRLAPWWKRLHGCIFYPAAIFVLGACILVVPCLEKVRDGEGWTRSAYSIKMIGVAIHNYHGAYGHLPPDGPLPALGGQYRKPTHFLCYELWRTPGFNVCFGDGSSRFIPNSTDEKALRERISRKR